MDEQRIGVIKLDSIGVIVTIVALAIIAGTFYIGSELGIQKEKISALEDIVFNTGVYEKLKKEIPHV